jgi:hypothetical protein
MWQQQLAHSILGLAHRVLEKAVLYQAIWLFWALTYVNLDREKWQSGPAVAISASSELSASMSWHVIIFDKARGQRRRGFIVPGPVRVAFANP